MFQPPRTQLEVTSQTIPVEPKEGRFLRADRCTLEQVASFRGWIALCRRLQIKTGRVLDGSVA